MDITLKYAMGEWLRRERRSRRMSAEELGRRLGYCKPSVYQWESGQVYLPLDNFIKCIMLLTVGDMSPRCTGKGLNLICTTSISEICSNGTTMPHSRLNGRKSSPR